VTCPAVRAAGLPPPLTVLEPRAGVWVCMCDRECARVRRGRGSWAARECVCPV